jgi:hypothetical protein
MICRKQCLSMATRATFACTSSGTSIVSRKQAISSTNRKSSSLLVFYPTPFRHRHPSRSSRRCLRRSSSMRYFSSSNDPQKTKVYDIFIVGGGVVGSTVAKLLVSGSVVPPLTIGILDSRRPKPLSLYSNCTSNDAELPFARSYALSPSSLITLGLEEGGVIDRIRKLGRVSNYDKMQVSFFVGLLYYFGFRSIFLLLELFPIFL